MSDETYQGWANRETWAFNLHWSNDQGFYNETLEQAQDYEPAPDGFVLAGNVTVCRNGGTYLLNYRGGTTSGSGDVGPALESAHRHGLIVGGWITRHIHTAGETVHTARLYERDWSLYRP